MNFILRRLRFPKPKQKHGRARTDLIDPRKRAGELTDQELIEGADSYFAKFSPDSIQYKKPFSDPDQVIHLTQHLALLFEGAKLFRGAKVLDFGCATGWLSLGMAQMGCNVVGVDISATAIRLAERLKMSRRVPSDGTLEFKVYDGNRLPLPDASFDCIVCSDAFHHVRDQAGTIREFARVLKDGGRISFVEPGPNHSKTEQSQIEMRMFKVLESDVSMKDIARYAQDAGLNPPQMLLQLPRPVCVPVEQFNDWAENGIPLDRAGQMVAAMQRSLTDLQTFFITKGQPRTDSRIATSLSGELRLIDKQPTATAGVWKLRFAARNTGTGSWLVARGPGQVRLGCQLWNSEGVVTIDFTRFDFHSGPIEPGQEAEIEATVRLPEMPVYSLKFDLVAEHVAWFSQLGKLVPVTVDSAAFLSAG